TSSVERLSFHLPVENVVVYDVDADLEKVLQRPTVATSMFLEWINQRVSIGRIHNVPILAGDAFYCRMLLNHILGVRSHDELKTIDD
ncbi:hypothetical protein Tco_1477922, partial [Tanacetum coccineum]